MATTSTRLAQISFSGLRNNTEPTVFFQPLWIGWNVLRNIL